MNKIETLSKAEEDSLSAYRDEFLSAGRSCNPADRKAAEAALTAMYARLGKKAPVVLWWDGPATGSLARTLLTSANLRANLRDNLRDNLGDNLWWSFWGQHECYWQAFYAFPHEVLRAMHTDEQWSLLSDWMTLSKSCGWWQPYEGAVFACERPERQDVDEQGRLHHESAAALLCRDGFGVHAWHGVRVPEYVIERPSEITVDKINAENNAEVRRVMIERFGQDHYLLESNAKQIHRDKFGVLYRKDIIGDEALTMVRVLNSTPEDEGSMDRDEALCVFDPHTPVCHDGAMLPLESVPQSLRFKDYFIRVPPAMKRSRQAIAWTFGMKEKEYNPCFQS